MRSLQLTDLDRGADPEARVERLGEVGLEPMQQAHAAADAVEGQHPGGVVQVHADPRRVRARHGLVHAVVPGGVARVGAQQAPGHVVVAQQTQRALALAADALVRHADGELAAPLDLPVEASPGQRLAAQHLGEAVEALRGVAVGLQVPGADHLLVAVGEVQLPVGRVGVQSQLAEVCGRTRGRTRHVV